MIRLGIVDFDTSHCIQFTRRLNHIGIAEEQWVEGAQIVIGCPLPSAITDQERIDEYTKEMSEELGVELAESPADMIGRVDGVLIEAVDGSVHLDRIQPFVEAGVPMYIDKPLACSVADAREILRLLRDKGLPVFSSSSLRYGLELVDIKNRQDELGAVIGADAYSPASLHERNPGLYHYGIHGVETLYALMGKGCQSVTCVTTEGCDVVTGLWEDGRVGTMRGTRAGGHLYGFTAFCEKKVVQGSINAAFIYRELLKQIVKMFKTGVSPIDPEETLEVIAFIESAKRSADGGGAKVTLET